MEDMTSMTEEKIKEIYQKELFNIWTNVGKCGECKERIESR